MPIIPPTNTTPATAYVLNGQLPLDGTIDLSGLANPQRVWFKYTLDGTSDFALAAYATGYDNGGTDAFRPLLTFYHDDPLDPSFMDGGPGTVEAFIEDSVGVPATGIIYFSLENSFIGAFTPLDDITIFVKLNPNSALPVGSPLINNDFAGFPATIIDPTTGLPTQIRSFAAGESAAILENGISLWSDASGNTTLHLYNADLELITNITFNRGGLRAPISSDRIDTFYAATLSLAPAIIASFSDAGVAGTQWTVTASGAYTLANIHHAAPSWIDTDIIYAYPFFFQSPPGVTVGDNFGICRFHKSTSTMDNQFIDFDTYEGTDYIVTGFYGREFLVLPDDSFLIMFRGFGSNNDSKVVLVDSAGAFVRNYAIEDADINRLAYDGITYTSFWTWSFNESDFSSRFIKFNIATGDIEEDFTLPTTSSGEAFSDDPTSISDPLFGAPECCPMVTTATALPPYGAPEPTPGGIYELVPGKRNDTIFTNVATGSTEDVEIPSPFIKTGLIGS